MAYINAKDVAAIRKELKAAYPNFKFSVRKHNSLSVHVTIAQGNVDFSDIFTDKGYAQINQYHMGNYGKHQQMFQNIVDIIKTAPSRGEGVRKDNVWYDNSDSQTDYFDTAYYFSISVGARNQPYTANKVMKVAKTAGKVTVNGDHKVYSYAAPKTKEVTVQELLASVGIDANVLLGAEKAQMRVVA